MKKLLAVSLLLMLTACGKRGDPRPPVPAIPRAASDLVVTQRGSKVILTWGYPALTTAGVSLHGVRRVTVFRYVEELPPPPAGQDPNAILPGDIDPTQPRGIALFAKVPPLTPMQFNKLKQNLDSIEGANLPEASVGAKLEYTDTPPFHAADGRPVRVTYAVVTVGESARSDLSNLASIVPLDVPKPPASLEANARPEGIVLAWTAPEKSVTGADKPLIRGYNVYRSAAGETSGELTETPVNTAPITVTTYADAPPYGQYNYRVTAVASAGPPRIESEPSERIAATFKDLQPPPAPKTVSALVETKSVRLVWDPVEAPDLVGYNIYRYQGDARLKLKLTPYPSTAPYFTDISIELGIEYVYAITSVDKSGNESSETSSEKVMAPRTP